MFLPLATFSSTTAIKGFSFSFFLSSGQAAADAKYYGNTEVYNILKARGAKAPVKHELLSYSLFKFIPILS